MFYINVRWLQRLLTIKSNRGSRWKKQKVSLSTLKKFRLYIFTKEHVSTPKATPTPIRPYSPCIFSFLVLLNHGLDLHMSTRFLVLTRLLSHVHFKLAQNLLYNINNHFMSKQTTLYIIKYVLCG